MKLVYDNINIKESKLDNFKGGEKYFKAFMYFDDNNRFFKGTLEEGCSIGLHKHENNSEIMYFISGTGKAICDGVEEIVGPGEVHYCPMGSSHTLINISKEPLVFFAVVPNHKE